MRASSTGKLSLGSERRVLVLCQKLSEPCADQQSEDRRITYATAIVPERDLPCAQLTRTIWPACQQL